MHLCSERNSLSRIYAFLYQREWSWRSSHLSNLNLSPRLSSQIEPTRMEYITLRYLNQYRFGSQFLDIVDN